MELITRALLIGGKEIEAADESLLDITNPANGELIARVAAAGEADIDTAVEVAQETCRAITWNRRSSGK